MTDPELSPGEIHRTLERIEHAVLDVRTRAHDLANSLHVAVGTGSLLAAKQDRLQNDLTLLTERVNAIDNKVNTTRRDAAYIAGVMSALGAVANFLWKH